MSGSKPPTHLQEDLCIHIFTVSAAMAGVCLTVIGLLRLVIPLRKADSKADDLLARINGRIVTEVKGIHRCVFGITSKPSGTIEWE